MHRYDTTFNGGITIGEGPIAYCATGVSLLGKVSSLTSGLYNFRISMPIPYMFPIAGVFLVVQIDQVQLLLHSTQVKPCTVKQTFWTLWDV